MHQCIKPGEIQSNFSTAKCHSSFCGAHLSCLPTVGPVAVSSSVSTVQSSSHTNWRCQQLPTTTLLGPLHPWRKTHFQTAHMIPPCLFHSHVPEAVNSTSSSFNAAVSSTSSLENPFLTHQTVILPSRSSFPKKTSTPTKTITEQPHF